MTPTARTLRYLRQNKTRACIAEYCQRHSFHTHDLFNFIDVVALDTSRRQIIGIQVTTSSNYSARKRKILGACRKDALDWLECGGVIEIWGWRQLAGQEKWTPRIGELTVDDFG